MTDFDTRISEGLGADDQAFLASLESDRGLYRQIGDSLTGPLGGWAKMAFVLSFVIGLGLVYSAWQVFTVADTAAIIRWAAVTLALLIMQGFLKQWMFSRMNMLSILREVKRLQLQLAMRPGGEA
ncbi:DUF6768 family protein [Qipengyuania marisflavi]|uniref:Uncharacterized protein n=1 Tax=Qipengyuania marisflavi TaxID=2486356 RepID=A0A5S3P745_9SPHN|nr:DUF6768 family protein [Qipengyuania marisflavi]TMM48842.1 hypothetical protein FEV51_05475 [Qipengyuania marisflavi]